MLSSINHLIIMILSTTAYVLEVPIYHANDYFVRRGVVFSFELIRPELHNNASLVW